MFNFIGSIFEFAFSMVQMGLELAFGAVELVFGLLGGLFSLILSMGALGIIVALIFVVRRGKKRTAQQEAASAQGEKVYDVDGEEFVSFYDQFRQQE